MTENPTANPNKQVIDQAQLDALARKVDELPVLPQVLVKILQLNSNADDYFEEFEQLVQQDPAFAVRVIALANSAVSAPVVPITTIIDALTRMGSTALRALVASHAVQRVFMPTEPGQISLWTHSISTAVACRTISTLLPSLKIDPGEAYLAGLLHDIGRFVMLEHTTASFGAVDDADWTTPEELIDADYAVYQFTHSELGYRACKNWGLPAKLASVVRTHHDVIDEEVLPESETAMRYCVQLADHASMSLLEIVDLDALSADERQGRVARVCDFAAKLAPPLAAKELDAAVKSMRLETQQLLAGLGFA